MPNQQGATNVLSDGSVFPHNAIPDPTARYPSTWGEFDVDPIEVQAERRFGAGAARAIGNALNSIWDYIKVPGEIYEGKYTLDEMARMAPSYALGLMGAGTPFGAAMAPEESLGIFGGAKSLSAPMSSLPKAEHLERSGLSLDDINASSGWFRPPTDKLWRYTISDENAKLNMAGFRPNQFNPDLIGGIAAKDPSLALNAEVPLSDLISHPDLFAAYPQLRDYPVKNLPYTSRARGMFSPGTKTFYLAGGHPENVLSTLLHEVQHAVQNIEGFTSGGAMQLPKDFDVREMKLQARARAFEQVTKAQHPELSEDDMTALGHLVRGYKVLEPREQRELLAKIHPQLEREFWPINYEAGALRQQSEEAYNKYMRIAGETEARAVQEQLALKDWTTPIWQHKGYIPFAEQTIQSDFGSLHFEPVEHDPFATELVPVEHDPFGEIP